MPRRKQSKINGHTAAARPINSHPLEDGGPLYVVRRSRIHGRGVFAVRTIPKGTRIVEYRGRRISYELATELYPDEGGGPTHTFLFELDNDLGVLRHETTNPLRLFDVEP